MVPEPCRWLRAGPISQSMLSIALHAESKTDSNLDA